MDWREAIAAIEELIAHARPMPLTHRVMVDSTAAERAVAGLRESLPAEITPAAEEAVDAQARVLPAVDELAAAVLEAPRVPLTGRLAVEREPVRDLLDRLTALIPGRAQVVVWKRAGEAGRAVAKAASALAGTQWTLREDVIGVNPLSLARSVRFDGPAALELVGRLRLQLADVGDAQAAAGLAAPGQAAAEEALGDLAEAIEEGLSKPGAREVRLRRSEATALVGRVDETLDEVVYPGA